MRALTVEQLDNELRIGTVDLSEIVLTDARGLVIEVEDALVLVEQEAAQRAAGFARIDSFGDAA